MRWVLRLFFQEKNLAAHYNFMNCECGAWNVSCFDNWMISLSCNSNSYLPCLQSVKPLLAMRRSPFSSHCICNMLHLPLPVIVVDSRLADWQQKEENIKGLELQGHTQLSPLSSLNSATSSAFVISSIPFHTCTFQSFRAI